MKIELSTKQGDFSIDLSTETDRLKFAHKLPRLITSKDFVFANMIEPEGTAKFASLEALIKALDNYID